MYKKNTFEKKKNELINQDETIKKKNKNELMGIIIYILLVVTYMVHFTNKRNNTYPVFVCLYTGLSLCYLYSKSENSDINYNKFISFFYLLLGMMYIYHMNMKMDSNYIYMGIFVFAISILKYMESYKTEDICMRLLNYPIVVFFISLLYIKHGIVQSEYDYLLSSILYGLLVYTLI